MKVKELKQILESLHPDCDEFPVRVQVNYKEEPTIIEINSNNFELDGTTIEESSLLFFKDL